MADFAKHGDFSALKGAWTIEGELDRKGTKTSCTITISETPGEQGKETRTTAETESRRARLHH